MRSETFERFYKEHYRGFFHFALRYVDDDEACRDIVSNAFEIAWKTFSEDDIDKWARQMLSIIHNKCIDYVRRNKLHDRYVTFRLRVDERMTDTDFFEREERVEIIRKLLEELPPKTRLILQECFINGRKYKEVGDTLDITDHAVKKHVIKALKYLREKVNKIK
ncbi:MAG: sigma-70 family RNA polymerase sigma factor [Prevotellaceae bacterium]|nr:sigma-70 family RNA polymerase sigma factor [Prevotellaceae bacterium]